MVFDRIANMEEGVENTTRKGVFLTSFEVFGSVVKHFFKCFTDLLNPN